MLKKSILLILVLLVLSGCTMPTSPEPTADLTEVQDIVASTLTAQAEFLAQQGTPTVDLPVATLTPSATLAPTATALLVTHTPTITVVPDGFRDTLGDPAWRDTLDDGAAFGLDEQGYQDDNTRIFMKDGAMVLSSSSLYGYRGWRLTTQSPANVYIEAEFIVDNCEDADLYGLVYRAPDYNSGQGYYLGLTCQGQFNVTKWTDSGSSTIVSAKTDEAIQAGPGQTNRLGIQMVGSDFYVHINDTLVSHFTDEAFTEGGHFGVFIAGQANGDLVVRMDEIAYWNLP